MSGPNIEMHISEILALSDTDLAQKITTLEQTAKQRARDDKTGLPTVTVEAAQAAKSLVPLVTEQKRRADQKKKAADDARFDAETKKREKDRARLNRQRKIFGGGL